MSYLPLADAVREGDDKQRYLKIVAQHQLVGAANNTKWNKLITFMRDKEGWTPEWKFQGIDNSSWGWDSEWNYHLPFPFISVKWFDINPIEEVHRGKLLNPEIIDHSDWIIELLEEIGFFIEVTKHKVIRIWGYTPVSLKRFNDSIEN